MRQARKNSFFMFMMAACLVACSSDDEPIVTPELRPLTVEISENDIVSTSTPQQAPTRADAATTTTTLNSFSMNYQDSQYSFNKTNGEWSTATWPSEVGNDVKIDFYAYNSGNLNWNSNDPYVSFDMGDNAFSQKDLLVAKNTVAYNDNGGKVALTFDHACAAVRFYIRKSVDQSVTINSVELSGVLSKGDYHYVNSEWQSLSYSNTYTLTNTSSIELTAEKQLLPCGYMFIIPQSKEGRTLKVSYTVDGNAKEYTFNLSGTWAAGHSYTININMGTKVINA